MQITFFARNVNKIAHFQGEVIYFVRGFFKRYLFLGDRNSAEKLFFYATIIKLNSQNSCIKSFPFSRHKEKQDSLLSASRKDSIFDYPKNPIKCKALFPKWNLKACNFMVFQTMRNNLIFRKLMPVAYRCFGRPTSYNF